MTYRVKATYYYYEGTYNAPRDGYVRGQDGMYLNFPTKQSALEWIDKEEVKIYYLNHGEYSSPSYKVVYYRGNKEF